MRQMMMRANTRVPRTGAVLLEVIVALTILSVTGASLAILAATSADAVRHANQATRDVQRASAFLSAVALWPRADLDRHLGDRAEGPWRLRIDRPLPTLYTVTLADSGAHAPLLRTALFRPEAPDAQ
jgi:type II secretory pathway pseudopilin PulG